MWFASTLRRHKCNGFDKLGDLSYYFIQGEGRPNLLGLPKAGDPPVIPHKLTLERALGHGNVRKINSLMSSQRAQTMFLKADKFLGMVPPGYREVSASGPPVSCPTLSQGVPYLRTAKYNINGGKLQWVYFNTMAL